MSVFVKVLVPSKTVEDSQTTQYIVSAGVTIIDKFTARNYSESIATITVHIVTNSGTFDEVNIIKTKSLAPGEVYMFPELLGQVLNVGDFISTLAGTGSSISFRVCGREIIQ